MAIFVHFLTDCICHCKNLIFIQLMDPFYLFVCRFDRIYDLIKLERYFLSVSFDHMIFHLNSHNPLDFSFFSILFLTKYRYF